jgi:hypothetical protein
LGDALEQRRRAEEPMRIVILVIGMAICAYLASMYINHASVMGVPGVEGASRPTDVLQHTKDATKQIEKDMAQRAGAPMPKADP